MNPLKKLAGQTAIYGLPTIVGRLLNYFLVPLYTYTFSKAEYGTVSEMYAYVSFLLIVLTYGMETALFNFSVKQDPTDVTGKAKIYGTILTSVLITSLLFITSLIFLAQPIADLIQHPDHPEYVKWFGLILGLDAISSIAFAKLREQSKAKKFALIKTINIAANIFFNIFFIVVCPKIIAHPDSVFYGIVDKIYSPSIGIGYIFISNLLASALTLLIQLPSILGSKFLFDRELLKKILPYALPLLLAGLAGMTNETIDRLLIKYLIPGKEGLEQNGIYGACYKISIIMTIFVQTFRYAAEPFFFSQAKEKNSKQTYADVMKYFVIICSIIFLGTMMNISWIQYFVGQPFRIGIAVVPILLLANLCLGVSINQSIWYKLTGQTRFGAYLTIFGAIITLSLNFYWIPIIGYMGSAYATLICYASMMVVSYFMGNKYFPVPYDLKKILGYLGIAILIYCGTTYIEFNSVAITLVVNNILLLGFIGFAWMMERKNLMQKKVVE